MPDESYIIKDENGKIIDYQVSQEWWDEGVRRSKETRRRAEIKFGICSCDNVITKECYDRSDPEIPHWVFLTHIKCEKLVPYKLMMYFIKKYRNIDDYYDKMK